MTICKKGCARLLLAILGALAVTALGGCGGGSGGSGGAPVGTPGTYMGTPQPLGNGTMTSYITIGSDGRPAAVGVMFSAAALSGLSDTAISDTILNLPPQGAITPVNHVDFLFEPNGHFPPGVYDVPQFDVSFFFVTPAFRQQIQAVGAANIALLYKVPSAEEAPPTYFLDPGSGVATFGVEYAYFQAPEFVGKGFTDTLDYLYYNGHMIGMQSLEALSFIKQNTNRVDNLETPEKYPATGYWPMQSAFRYDPVAQVYTISLEGFVYRD